MAGSLTKGQLIFDPSDAADSDNIGAYLRAGSDGDLLSSTLIGSRESLDVSVGLDAANQDEFGIFAEDAAHTTGDLGIQILAVRNDTQGSLVDTDGDYGSLQLDSAGRLRTVTDLDLSGDLVPDDDPIGSESPLLVGHVAHDTSAALDAVSADDDKAQSTSDLYRRNMINDAPNISVANTQVSVGAVEVALPQLAGRMRMHIRNTGNNSVWIGPTGVTTATGWELKKGEVQSFDAGEALAFFAIAAAGGESLNVIELA